LVGPEIVVNKNEERRRVSAEVIYQAFGELDRAKANRRRMLRISESSSPPAYESTGSRAIPHFEQTPGPSATTSGCIGQAYFVPVGRTGGIPSCPERAGVGPADGETAYLVGSTRNCSEQCRLQKRYVTPAYVADPAHADGSTAIPHTGSRWLDGRVLWRFFGGSANARKSSTTRISLRRRSASSMGVGAVPSPGPSEPQQLGEYRNGGAKAMLVPLLDSAFRVGRFPTARAGAGALIMKCESARRLLVRRNRTPRRGTKPIPVHATVWRGSRTADGVLNRRGHREHCPPQRVQFLLQVL
jgi:hypothetical protein